MVKPALSAYQPHVVILMGGWQLAWSSAASRPRRKMPLIGRWRGFQILARPQRMAMPDLHPSDIMREDKRPEIETVWRQDLKAAIDLLDQPVLDLWRSAWQGVAIAR